MQDLTGPFLTVQQNVTGLREAWSQEVPHQGLETDKMDTAPWEARRFWSERKLKGQRKTVPFMSHATLGTTLGTF